MNNIDLNKILEKIFLKKSEASYFPTEEDIFDFEKKHQVTIPKDFKFFLLNWGGYDIKNISDSVDTQVIFPLKSRKFGKSYLSLDSSLRFDYIFSHFNNNDLPKWSLEFSVYDNASIFITLSPEVEGQVFYMEKAYYEEDHDTILIKDCEPDNAINLFDPINNVIPYYFTKLADSFSEFISKIKIVNYDSLEAAEEKIEINESIDWSKIIEY